jgi:NTP pyrophosphatase (non-canonical NTP hydrolase)
MHFNTYQHEAGDYAEYEQQMYPVVSLMVEAAELADLFVKPVLRGDAVAIEDAEIISEAGDVLWNLSCLLRDRGITLEQVAVYNLMKLSGRKERGVIRGSGGNR